MLYFCVTGVSFRKFEKVMKIIAKLWNPCSNYKCRRIVVVGGLSVGGLSCRRIVGRRIVGRRIVVARRIVGRRIVGIRL